MQGSSIGTKVLCKETNCMLTPEGTCKGSIWDNVTKNYSEQMFSWAVKLQGVEGVETKYLIPVKFLLSLYF